MSMQGSCGKVAVDIQKFIITNFLAIVFLLALVLALSWPAPGIAINEVTVLNGVRIVQEVFIGVVFFISGLGLDTQALKRLGVRRMWGAFAYSIVAMLLVTPLIGFAYVKLPLTPIEFDYGLCIWVAMPTTLGVGVALVRSCGGNDSLGTIITVVSNVLAIFIVPPMLKFLFLGLDQGSGSLQFSINIDIPDLLLKLSITILAPAVVGKVLRDYWKLVELFAVKYKTHLSLFSSSLLAGIIYFNISSARDSLLQTPGGMIASLIALVSATYLFFQALNLLLVHYVLKYDPYESVALVILSSQKSAPVAMTVISYITHNTTQQGLLAIPAIIGQLAQIFIGAALVPFVEKRVKAFLNSQREEREEPAAAIPPPRTDIMENIHTALELESADDHSGFSTR